MITVEEANRISIVNSYIRNTHKSSKPFDYVTCTKRESDRAYWSLTPEEALSQLNYSKDKLKNIRRLYNVQVQKYTFGCIEARIKKDAQEYIQFQVIDAFGSKEMFVRVNLFQPFRDILKSVCERLGKDVGTSELVYNNSTMWLDDMVGPVYSITKKSELYLF